MSESDRSSGDSEQTETVLRWFGPHQRQHRIQVSQIPGSAHWNILKDSRKPHSGDWERDWANEATRKPDFRSLHPDSDTQTENA